MPKVMICRTIDNNKPALLNKGRPPHIVLNAAFSQCKKIDWTLCAEGHTQTPLPIQKDDEGNHLINYDQAIAELQSAVVATPEQQGKALLFCQPNWVD